jgi:molecular chaperone Hsp33
MTTLSSNDQLHRFVFDDADIRGEIVSVNQSFAEASLHQNLPLAAQCLLGEFLVAVSLLAEALKFSGILTLQARGDGPVPLIMSEANEDGGIRGIIKVGEHTDVNQLIGLNLQQMVGNGVLTLTIDPTEGKRYQGIVALSKATLAECLNDYFSQSEQLPTQFWLAADTTTAAGLMLQALPPSLGRSDPLEQWSTAQALASTVTDHELLTLDHPSLLLRLFNEFEVRLFAPQPLNFACHCSYERSANALSSLGRADAFALLAERDIIEMKCEFCGNQYVFGETDLTELFAPDQPLH